MAKRVVNESSLTSVADAIRDKSGTTSSLVFPEGFISAIGSITPGEGGITPNGTINITTNGIHDVTSFASANVNVPTSGGDIVNGDDIEVGSLSELHAWSKYSIGDTLTRTNMTDVLLEMVMDGDGVTVEYADEIDTNGGYLELSTKGYGTVTVTNDSSCAILKGKAVRTNGNQGYFYYEIPSYATVTYRYGTNYGQLYASEATRVTYTPADGEFVGIVVSEDSNAYPQNGEQDGYRYVYNGTLDSLSGALKALDVTPSASGQEFNPPAGYDGFSKVTVAGDADLVAGNIKNGVEIFGVTGSYVGTGGTVLPTLTAPGAAGDLANGKQLIDANGNIVTGTVKDSRAWYGTYSAEPEIYTSGEYKYVMFKTKPSEPTMVRDTVELCASVSKFGDATAGDVVKGKTFTSKDGLKVTGTIEEYGDDGNSYGWEGAMPCTTEQGIGLSGTARSDMLFRKGCKFTLTTQPSNFGDATAADVLAGKTFTSAAGVKVVGTMPPGSFTVTDDGAGNVTITSSAITDNDGNVVIA